MLLRLSTLMQIGYRFPMITIEATPNLPAWNSIKVAQAKFPFSLYCHMCWCALRLCNHLQNALARYGDSTSTSSKGRDVHDNTRNTSSEFSLQSSAAGEKQLTNFLLPWRFQIHFDILKGFAFHAWSSSVKNISCILNFFPGYVLHPVKMYPSLGLTGSSNIYLKCCLKRSEGGRRPTERSVFKFFLSGWLNYSWIFEEEKEFFTVQKRRNPQGTVSE